MTHSCFFLSCCTCPNNTGAAGSLPLICLVPRDDARLPESAASSKRLPAGASKVSGNSPEFQLFDDEYLKKHYELPQRALYLDPFRRPLITFPMTQEESKNFNMAKKTKINQQILDGFLNPSAAITSPSVFPYAKTEAEKRKDAEEDEEIIYILQLPDWEFKCPIHSQTIRTPRFIWHSCKNSKKGTGTEIKQGGGPMNKPKPWLLSRHTDFDLLSQW